MQKFIQKSKHLDKLINPFDTDSLVVLRRNIYNIPVRFLSGLGVTPNFVNLLGLLFGIFAAILVGLGNVRNGVTLYFLSGFCDSLDGPIARYRGLESKFGAFFDSVSDRYVDISMFIGIAWFYIQKTDYTLSLLALLSILGASITSYTKARAESLGSANRSIGIMGRVTRGFLLLFGLLFIKWLPAILWIQAIFSNITAIQRLIFYILDLQKYSEEND